MSKSQSAQLQWQTQREQQFSAASEGNPVNFHLIQFMCVQEADKKRLQKHNLL